MKFINMASAITLFAASYANASQILPIDEGETPIEGTVDGMEEAFFKMQEMYNSATAVDEGIEAAAEAFNS